MDSKKKIRVIGYGNPTRRDDRVGWYVVEQLQKKLGYESPVELQTVHQLEIELADEISGDDLVIFVDTHVSEEEDWKRITHLEPGYEMGVVTHHLTPATLIGLTKALYQKEPQGVLFSVKGTDFNFGEKLSANTQKYADEVVEDILKYIAE
jgi:hydrogenase maturation protease